MSFPEEHWHDGDSLGYMEFFDWRVGLTHEERYVLMRTYRLTMADGSKPSVEHIEDLQHEDLYKLDLRIWEAM